MLFNSLFIRNVKDIKSFQNHIAKMLIIISISGLILAVIIFSSLYYLYLKRENLAIAALINNANSIFAV
jgi:hypothetical protein